MAKTKPPDNQKVENTQKRSYGSQSDVPVYTLEESLRVAQALYENFGGKPAAPHQVAIALDISPTSSTWNLLPGASIAYGLTTGGGKATEIALTELGRKIVAPEDDGEDDNAKVEACLKPKIVREFFERYDKGKFPKDVIAKNVLISLGVPKDKVDKTYTLVLANGNFAKLIQETKTGPFVYIDKSKLAIQKSGNGTAQNSEETEEEIKDDDMPDELASKLSFKKPPATINATEENCQILNQKFLYRMERIKKLLSS